MGSEGRLQQLRDPSNIFNLDEIGFKTNAKYVKCIFRRGDRKNHTISFGAPHGHLTMLCCVNAAGEAQKPLFLLKGKQKLEQTIEQYELDGFAARASQSGYTTTSDFEYYLRDVFVPEQKSKGNNGPFTIFLDNASAHCVLDILWLARELNITLITLFPNSTAVTQVLDLTVFKHMKDLVGKIIRSDFQDEVISMRNFSKVIKKVYALMFPSVDGEFVPNKLVIKGFRETGVFPFDSSNMQFDLLFEQQPRRLIESTKSVIEMKKHQIPVEDFQFVDTANALSQETQESHDVSMPEESDSSFDPLPEESHVMLMPEESESSFDPLPEESHVMIMTEESEASFDPLKSVEPVRITLITIFQFNIIQVSH